MVTQGKLPETGFELVLTDTALSTASGVVVVVAAGAKRGSLRGKQEKIDDDVDFEGKW